jgi:protein TonB
VLHTVPNKFVLTSLSVHLALVVGLIHEGFFSPQEVILVKQSTSQSVQVMLDDQPEVIQKELKKVLKKKIKTFDLADKVIPEEETSDVDQDVVRTVSLSKLEQTENLSPELKNFLKNLRSEISRRHKYPYAAKRLRQSGEVLMKFDVYIDGSIKNIAFQKKCKYERLNSSAMETVASIARLDHFPKNVIKKDRISVSVPIKYTL